MFAKNTMAGSTEWQRMIEPITSEAAPEPQDQQQAQDGLQAHFQPHISADEIEQVYHLKRAAAAAGVHGPVPRRF
jgi:hypothetical protein